MFSREFKNYVLLISELLFGECFFDYSKRKKKQKNGKRVKNFKVKEIGEKFEAFLEDQRNFLNQLQDGGDLTL